MLKDTANEMTVTNAGNGTVEVQMQCEFQGDSGLELVNIDVIVRVTARTSLAEVQQLALRRAAELLEDAAEK